MMKGALYPVVGATAALLVGTTASAADPARPGAIHGSVKFYLDARYLKPLGEGTFATSGAFTDSGDFVSVPAGSTTAGKTIVWHRFIGRRGSIVVQDVFAPTETGSWTIPSGTGVYANLHGHGTSIGSSLGTNVAPGVLPPQRAIAVATGTVS
jgi:hypothetical protein